MVDKTIESLLKNLEELGFNETYKHRKVISWENTVNIGEGVFLNKWRIFEDYKKDMVVCIKTDYACRRIYQMQLILPLEIQYIIADGFAKLENVTGINYIDTLEGHWDKKVSRKEKEFMLRLYQPLFDAIDSALECFGITISDIHNPVPYAKSELINLNDTVEEKSRYDLSALKKYRIIVDLNLGYAVPEYFDEYFYYRMGNAIEKAKENFEHALAAQISYAKRIACEVKTKNPNLNKTPGLAYRLMNIPLG